MIVLALDTTLSATSVAVIRGEKILAARSEAMERGHQERLANVVRDVMAAGGVGFEALDRIGVAVGPGSFTGLRVGLAFAKGLSVALDKPCVGVGTLEALAGGAASDGVVFAAVDAGRGRVYLQGFENGVPLGDPEALPLSEAEDRLRTACGTRTATLIGPGATLLAVSSTVTVDHRPFPDPAVLARLAASAAAPSASPQPLYLRPPDAKTIAERAAAS